jgi:uncharacterized membrane protein
MMDSDNRSLTKERRPYPTTPEGNLFAMGVTLSIVWLCGLILLWRCQFALFGNLLSMVTAHLVSGRAGGISVGLERGVPEWVVIVNATVIDSMIVLLIYPLFVFSERNLLRTTFLKGVIQTSIESAQKGQARISRFGIVGLLLFVWFPLHMTGPLAGSIIGYFLRLDPYLNITVVLTGTFLAVLSWVFLFRQIIDQMGGYSYLIPVFVVTAALIGFVVLRAKQRRASRE